MLSVVFVHCNPAVVHILQKWKEKLDRHQATGTVRVCTQFCGSNFMPIMGVFFLSLFTFVYFILEFCFVSAFAVLRLGLIVSWL